MDTSSTDAKAHWEEHYGERDRVWSGRVNARLAEVVPTLEPGRALDLGCGEGGDACWLAERAWPSAAGPSSQSTYRIPRCSARLRMPTLGGWVTVSNSPSRTCPTAFLTAPSI